MLVTNEVQTDAIRIASYRCDAGPDAQPFTEMHEGYSVSYVRKGSFGYRTRGNAYELVAGSVLVGCPGDEYVCTHDHHVCGDECLAFHLSPGFVDLIGGDGKTWRAGGVPPLAELVVIGELAQAAADDNRRGGHARVAYAHPACPPSPMIRPARPCGLAASVSMAPGPRPRFTA